MPVPMLNVVIDTPESDHGEIAEKPMPAPNAISSRVSAALANPSAATAAQLMAEDDASVAMIGSIMSLSAAMMETSAARRSVMDSPSAGCFSARRRID